MTPFDSVGYALEEGMGPAMGIWMSLLSTNLLSFGMAIAAYVLTALSLYTVAQRRGIRRAWMAWVPVLDLWILGSIADQYRYVARGQVKNRRKVLIVLSVIQAVAAAALTVFCVAAVVNVIAQIPRMAMMHEQQLLELVLGTVLPMVGAALLMGILAIVLAVFKYIAYYDLFASCDPENKVLFLVLGILFGVTLPFFVFACRNKDRGMPPRKAPPVQEPISEPAPEEPWNNE